MSHRAAMLAEAVLQALADWSVRWGALLLLVLIWFVVRPPRAAQTRYAVLVSALVAGLLLPLVPRWGGGLLGPVAAPGPGFESPRAGRHGTSAETASTPPAAIAPDPAGRGVDSAAGDSSTPDVARNPPASLGGQLPAISTLDNLRIAAVALWVGGLLTVSLRLALGWRAVWSLRRGARTLRGEAPERLARCCAEMGIRSAPRLASHDAVAAPVLIGGLSPAILVPPDWADLPAEARRAALLHELSHLARRDDVVRLLLALCRAALFFHPLVHWLAARCRDEQEALCDETVIGGGVDRRDYARILLDFSRRAAGSRTGLPGGSLPFLQRPGLKNRIRRILEVRMSGTSTAPSRRRLAVASLALLSIGLGLGSVRVLALAGPPPARDAEPAADGDPPAARDVPVEAPRPRPAAEELPAAQARRKAVDFLRGRQEKSGAWRAEDSDRYQIGVTSLCTLALLRNGVAADDPQIRSALQVLAANEPEFTYEIVLRTIACCAADPRKYETEIRWGVRRLEEGQIVEGNAGMWSYTTQRGVFDLGGDNSNTQFALWGLAAAADAGFEVRPATWERAVSHWLAGQNSDGGWGYTPSGRADSTGSMTAAGIASLAAAMRHLPEKHPDRDAAKEAVARAEEWLARHFAVRSNPGSRDWVLYYLKTLRRAGDLTGTRKYGEHDWHRLGIEYLLDHQNGRGYWIGVGNFERDPVIGTSLALLFLSPAAE